MPCKWGLPCALDGVDGSILLLVLEGQENTGLSIGNETFVMRNSIYSIQNIKLNLRLTQLM